MRQLHPAAAIAAACLVKAEHAKLVWALCADGTRWELVCWRFGITCATSHRRWQYGRSLIAWGSMDKG